MQKKFARFLLPLLWAAGGLAGCESPKENYAFDQEDVVVNEAGQSCGGLTVRASRGTDAERFARMQAMYEEFRDGAFPSVPEVTASEARTLLDSGEAVLIDARLDSERAISIIPGAIGKAAFESDPEAYRGKLLISYCTIGYRSGVYTRKLVNRGFRAKNLKGSILAWAHAGYLFENNGEPTKCAHVFGESWNLMPRDYLPVW